jgi:hypothetical protein
VQLSKWRRLLLSSLSSYIVDFEDYRIIDLGEQKPPEFEDREFEYWDLDEESVQQYRRLELSLTDDD